MTQYFANLFQRAAVVKHLGRERVPKLMGSMCRRLHPRAFNGIPDNAGDRGRVSKAAKRSFAAQE